jgi:hypothetical protein
LAVLLVAQLSVAGTVAVRWRGIGHCDVRGGSAALTEQLRPVCEAAIRRVTAVWGEDWSRHVDVVLARSSDAVAHDVPDAGDVREVAAVVDGRLRVVVNAAAFATLTPTGRVVVLAHEITHVATRAPTSPGPTWLVEGFADYVGFLDQGIPVRRAAAELAGQIRAGKMPRALPTDAAFSGSDLSSVYQQSWLAVVLMARLIDQSGVVRVYRAVQGGTPLERALQHEHLSTADLTVRWRRDLRRQLG